MASAIAVVAANSASAVSSAPLLTAPARHVSRHKAGCARLAIVPVPATVELPGGIIRFRESGVKTRGVGSADPNG